MRYLRVTEDVDHEEIWQIDTEEHLCRVIDYNGLSVRDPWLCTSLNWGQGGTADRVIEAEIEFWIKKSDCSAKEISRADALIYLI